MFVTKCYKRLKLHVLSEDIGVGPTGRQGVEGGYVGQFSLVHPLVVWNKDKTF